MEKKVDWKVLRGDFFGAGAAAVITIPLAIAYGLIAFAPLGPDFASQSAVIGLFSAFFTCFIASMLGGTPILITAPTAALILMMSTITGFLAESPVLSGVPYKEAAVVALMSLSVVIAGAVQVAFSLFRLGNLVKYVPYPVMAGFMNGIATLLIVKQIGPLLGIESETHLLSIVLNPGLIKPMTCLVSFFTLAAIFLSRRWIRRIPGSFVGLLSGMIFYYALRFLLDPVQLGPTLGRIDLQLARPVIFPEIIQQVGWGNLPTLMPTLVLGGIMIGLIGSMESLLSAVKVDELMGSRHNSNRELLGQGVGNTVSGIFGCLPGAGAIAETLDNHRAGGQTRLSSFLTAVLILLMASLLNSFIGIIPIAVFAAMVTAIGLEMVDRWFIEMLRQLPRADRHRRSIIGNLGIALAVTVLMISINLLVAVGIGIIIASIMFISKMGRSPVRRKYVGSQLQSKRVRNLQDTRVLSRLSERILVFELHGPIFFGSGDNLVKEIHESMKAAEYCILDLKRVNEIDATGVKSMVRANRILTKEKKRLLISYLHKGAPIMDFLNLMGFEKEFGGDQIFTDTDAALEAAENDLLKSRGLESKCGEIEICEMELLKGFTSMEIQSLTGMMTRVEYQKGDMVIGNSELSRDLYLMARGSVSIRVPLAEGDYEKRLATYMAGTAFGEMAFLDGAPRSAEVVCDEQSVIFVLPYEKYESLSAANPDLALKFTRNIAQMMSWRLRKSSLEIAFLEEH